MMFGGSTILSNLSISTVSVYKIPSQGIGLSIVIVEDTWRSRTEPQTFCFQVTFLHKLKKL